MAEAARASEQAARCWRLCGAPERHKKQCRDLRETLDWRDAHDSVIKGLDSGGLIALIGKPGTGKTQIGVCALRFFCLNIRQPCAYVVSADLFAQMRAAYGAAATTTEHQVFREQVAPKLLVIDEIDKRAGTDAEHRLLHRVLDARYREMRPTLLIGNVDSAEALAALLDGPGGGIGPLFDRLRETGGVVELFNGSFRDKGVAS